MTEEIVSAAAESVTPAAAKDVIFTPLKFNNLEVENQISGPAYPAAFDNEDGSLTQTRINWECKFAKGGIGAIVSSYVPVLMKIALSPATRPFTATTHSVLAKAWRGGAQLRLQIHNAAVAFRPADGRARSAQLRSADAVLDQQKGIATRLPVPRDDHCGNPLYH